MHTISPFSLEQYIALTKLTRFVKIKTHKRCNISANKKWSSSIFIRSLLLVLVSWCSYHFFFLFLFLLLSLCLNENALYIHLTVCIHCQRKLLIANPTRQNCFCRRTVSPSSLYNVFRVYRLNCFHGFLCKSRDKKHISWLFINLISFRWEYKINKIYYCLLSDKGSN